MGDIRITQERFLEGRVALVTGAGGGIGAAVSRRLAELGAAVVLADLREAAVALVLETLPAGPHETWVGDLTSEDAVRELFRGILERRGRIDVAVNAAGILRIRPFEEITKAEWDFVMDANAGSAFLVCRECCAPMKAQGWGRIVNFSSVAGQVGGILSGAHYAASKAAIISLTRSVAKYLAPYGIRCNVVAPSGVETEMLAQFSPEQADVLREGIPVKRFGTVEEVAELVAWLTSPATDYLTGQTLNLNGGAYLG